MFNMDSDLNRINIMPHELKLALKWTIAQILGSYKLPALRYIYIYYCKISLLHASIKRKNKVDNHYTRLWKLLARSHTNVS